jgi:hypothetical protein
MMREILDVQMSQEFLRVACFLCEDRGAFAPKKRTPVATAFIVSVPCEEDQGVRWEYLVTARHVIEQSDADTLYIRINRKDQGGYTEYETRRDDWSWHDQADVAAIRTPVPAVSVANQVEYMAIDIRNSVGPGPRYGINEGEVVTIGDEVLAAGLFLQNYGKERNLPVARFGHVSRMPDTVDITYDVGGYKTSLEVVAYLVEFLSWSGGQRVAGILPSAFACQAVSRLIAVEVSRRSFVSLLHSKKGRHHR